ncbi:MAG: hypothetical protein AB8H86_32620 [Polyangiales bacterium]
MSSPEETQQAARYESAVQTGALPAEEATGIWREVMNAARFAQSGAGAPPSLAAFAQTEPGTLGHARLIEAQLRVCIAKHTNVDALVAESHRASPVDSRAALVASLAEAWRRWSAGEAVDADALADAQRRAAAERMPALSIELMSVLALVDLRAGDRDGALRRARIASRMGRSEGIPYAEVLANLTLARVRRMHARPHFALRILRGLRRYAPPIWHSWLSWEALMAGRWNEEGAPLWPLLKAASEGTRSQLHAAAGELDLSALPQPLQADAHAAIALLTRGDEDSALNAWRDGTTDALPPALAGLAFALPSPGSAAFHSWVAVGGEASEGAARISHLESELAKNDGFAVLDRPHQPRADTGVAMLSLAKEPIEKEAYFHALYGFPFEAALHAATFSMHLSRVRERIQPHATLITENETLHLVHHARVLLPDPRCKELLAQRALRVLAEYPDGLSTRALAATLGSTLRTAQRAIHALMDDGVIESTPQGRGTVYSVEDSTFSEPTMSRTFDPPPRR